MMAAVIAAASQLAIPLPLVPINLALLAVFMAGFLLEGRWALASVLLYLLMGAAGLPVFAGFRGGPQHLLGPTGGYLTGYLLAVATVAGLKPWAGSFIKRALVCALATIVCYVPGTAWLMWLTGRALPEALGLAVLPFLPGDALKCLAAAYLAPRLNQISRAFSA
ncbi:MAG: biotin transporter BioY [Eubacteriales bacterium]|nr:biotin transporter BioY [Eubacteriales bacterium]